MLKPVLTIFIAGLFSIQSTLACEAEKEKKPEDQKQGQLVIADESVALTQAEAPSVQEESISFAY